MRTKILLGAALILSIFSCTDSSFNDFNSFVNDNSIHTINGTWRVISFEDFSNEKVELKNQTNSWGMDILINLDDMKNPHEFSGLNTSNSVGGEFEYNSARQIKIRRLGTTFVAQPEWGDKFGDALLSGNLDFIVSSKSLRIFYNNKHKSITFTRQ